MSKIFKMRILDIQPSQLYMSEKKLNEVFSWLNKNNIESYGPISIKKLNERIIFTDGHTRAFALYKMGVEEIHCVWDEDDLDLEAYQICVDWCIEEGITNISHLEKRVIKHDTYEMLWHDRCRKMQEELEEKRKQANGEFYIDSQVIWYHGSNKVFEILEEGSTITQWKELAEAFSHKPTILAIDDDNSIYHNGKEYGYLYIIDEPIEMDKDIYPHANSTMAKGLEFLTKRKLKVRFIAEIGFPNEEYQKLSEEKLKKWLNEKKNN